ncbi:MAG: alcohol dehydrogenase catalytic domain-containing protein [Acidobacteriota bacterium]|nr:alcohol dehydrogenase catalytic domain-containing protein [Acidobacteriota bacterium]MDH3784034.1 alcohol dehydrogenase catalytic domain-containing protein [Acidobacteriota bacterium]
MKIQAAVLEEFGQPLQIQSLELGDPQSGEVRVKIEACGVCHTDLYTASGADPSGYAPCVLGHEGAGVVDAVGDGVTSVKPGDHVVTLFSPECGECVHCRSGKTNICMAIRDTQGRGCMPDGTPRLSRDGEPIRHFMGTSTFAEYTVMPEIALAKVHPEAPMEQICLLACGATTGIAAAMWKAEVEAGATVAVFGMGMVGLGAVVGARLQNAGRIIAVDLSRDRLEAARPFGVTDTILVGEDTDDPVAAIQEMTDGFGADYTFEATGNVAVMGQAVEAARMGWGICTVLGVAGKGEALQIVPRNLITGRRVQGGSFGGARGRTHVPQLVQMMVDGKLDLGPFVSHRVGLDDVNHAFELMERQDGIRSVITFDG